MPRYVERNWIAEDAHEAIEQDGLPDPSQSRDASSTAILRGIAGFRSVYQTENRPCVRIRVIAVGYCFFDQMPDAGNHLRGWYNNLLQCYLQAILRFCRSERRESLLLRGFHGQEGAKLIIAPVTSEARGKGQGVAHAAVRFAVAMGTFSISFGRGFFPLTRDEESASIPN